MQISAAASDRLHDRISRWSIVVILSICAVWAPFFFNSTLDDALITFRYAQRWSEGYQFGLWNKTGEPVEGFTTFLWMIILSVAGPSQNGIASASKYIGLLSHIGLVLLFYQLHRAFAYQNTTVAPKEARWLSYAFLSTSILVALCPPMAWYATTGMETVTFALLVALCVFSPFLTSYGLFLGALAVIITLLRPEGVLVSVSCALFWFLSTRNKVHLVSLGLAIATFVALVSFRLHYFGYPLPNTYYAKSGSPGILHLATGLRYYAGALLTYWPITLPAFGLMIYALVVRQRLLPIFWFLIACQLAYAVLIMRSGGDPLFAFPMYRHFLVLLPLFAFCLFLLTAPLTRLRWP